VLRAGGRGPAGYQRHDEPKDTENRLLLGRMAAGHRFAAAAPPFVGLSA
jgi:hypothetical protein